MQPNPHTLTHPPAIPQFKLTRSRILFGGRVRELLYPSPATCVVRTEKAHRGVRINNRSVEVDKYCNADTSSVHAS